MLKIDSHQHFWKFNQVKHSWIDDTMQVLQRDFYPSDIAPLLQQHDIDGCISVQVDQSETENGFLLDLAAGNPFIKGVVGWVDLIASNVEDRLSYYARFDKLKGFRHMLQGERDRAYMLRPDFKRGISKLNQFGYTYDILIHPDQLSHALEFVAAFTNQPFVIDHLAKPYIKNGLIDDWKKHLTALAAHQNVFCKLSGMVTEADWKNWQYADLRPYMDVVFEAFGTKRIMFGSDWPVCTVAATYGKTIAIPRQYLASFSTGEQADFWGGTAARVYNL